MGNAITVPVGYSPFPWQSTFHNSRARVRVVCPSVRQGKTVSLAAETVIAGTELYQQRLSASSTAIRLTPLVNFWFISSTYKLLDQSIAEITRMLPKEFESKFDKNTGKFLIFPYKNNLGKRDYHWIISMRSAERPDLLVAEGVDLIVFDEARDISADVFNFCLSRLEPGRAGLMIIGGTPGSRLDKDNPYILGDNGEQVENLHWQYKQYLRGQDKDDAEVESWRFDCYSPQRNPRITDEWIERQKQDMSADTFRRDMLAEFIRYEQEIAVISEYNAGLQFRDIQSLYDYRRPLYHVWDFGWSTPALTAHQVIGDQWLQLAERQGSNVALRVFARQAIQSLTSKYGDAKDLFVIVPGSGRAHKATDGETEIDMLRQVYRELGFNISPQVIQETEETIERGIEIQRIRCGKNEKGEVLSLIDTSCVITHEAMSGGWHRSKNRYFKSGQPKPFKDGLFDHVADTRNLFVNSGALDILGRSVEQKSYIRKQQRIKPEQAFWVNT